MLQPGQFAPLAAILWNPEGFALVVFGTVAGKEDQQVIVFSQLGSIIVEVCEDSFAGRFFASLIGQENDVCFFEIISFR